MVLVALAMMLFFVFGAICAVLSVPAIVWAFIAMYRSQTRIHGFIVLAAGALGIVLMYYFVLAIHSEWLPTNNVFLCWLHFFVPHEQPYRFFYTWVPIGFVGPATYATFLTGGNVILRKRMKNKSALSDDGRV